MQGNLPPEAQEKIEELQQLQETAQTVAVQKTEAESQLEESRTALKELEDIEEDTGMYRQVGELLVATDLETAREDLDEKVERLEVRLSTLEKQEERVQEQFEGLQEELQQLLGGGLGGGGPAGPSAGG